MNPYITEITPLTVAGWAVKIEMPGVARYADIPAFYFSELYGIEENKKFGDTTYSIKEHFKKSNVIKHCEIVLCYETFPSKNKFVHFFGRAIVHPDDKKNILPDMAVVELSGLYAIFTTPLVPAEKDEQYEQTIKDTWNEIMNKWLPNSEFEYDDSRRDFEYYDIKDHGQFSSGKKQMDIYLPIRQREEFFNEAVKNGFAFVETYT